MMLTSSLPHPKSHSSKFADSSVRGHPLNDYLILKRGAYALVEGDDKEKALPRVQNKPPQPPKLKNKPSFLLNSFEFFADDDAESWLTIRSMTPYF